MDQHRFEILLFDHLRTIAGRIRFGTLIESTIEKQLI